MFVKNVRRRTLITSKLQRTILWHIYWLIYYLPIFMAASLVKEYLTGTTVLARVCSTCNFYVIYHMFIYIWRLAIICSILQCLCYISYLYLDLKIPNQEHNICFYCVTNLSRQVMFKVISDDNKHFQDIDLVFLLWIFGHVFGN